MSTTTFRQFVDRADELRRLRDVVSKRGSLVLFGERRQGKTRLLRRLAEAVERDGGLFLFVDLWRVTSTDELVERILRQLPSGWLTMERAGRLVRGFEGHLSLGVDPSGQPKIGVEVRTGRDARTSGHDLQLILERIDDLASEVDSPVVMAFDEFQRIEDLLPGGAGVLRGVAQDSAHTAWLFAGSILRMVRELIGPKGPFYGMEALEVGPIEGEWLASWVQSVLEPDGAADGVGPAIVELAGPITEHVFQLAEFTQAELLRGRGIGAGDVADLIRDYVALKDGSFEVIWNDLHAVQKRLLRAVAAGEEELSSARVVRDYGIETSQKAIYHRDQLRDRGILMQTDPPRLADPFFRAWIHPPG